MNEAITARNNLKKIFSNTTSRSLLAVWLLVKGSRFSLKSLEELIALPEDALEAKLQTFAGMGLVHVITDEKGERQIEFLASPASDLEKTIWELFEGRKNDFEIMELKLRSMIYKNLLNSAL